MAFQALFWKIADTLWNPQRWIV